MQILTHGSVDCACRRRRYKPARHARADKGVGQQRDRNHHLVRRLPFYCDRRRHNLTRSVCSPQRLEWDAPTTGGPVDHYDLEIHQAPLTKTQEVRKCWVEVAFPPLLFAMSIGCVISSTVVVLAYNDVDSSLFLRTRWAR